MSRSLLVVLAGASLFALNGCNYDFFVTDCYENGACYEVTSPGVLVECSSRITDDEFSGSLDRMTSGHYRMIPVELGADQVLWWLGVYECKMYSLECCSTLYPSLEWPTPVMPNYMSLTCGRLSDCIDPPN